MFARRSPRKGAGRSARPFLPNSTGGWAAAAVCLCVILLVTLPVFAPVPARWYLVFGRSMRPLLTGADWPPYPAGYIHVNPHLPVAHWSVIYFRVNGRYCDREVKRVQYRSAWGGEPCYWVSTDNRGVTGEASDFSGRYTWIKQSWVIGVVDGVWTPQRARRSRTAVGRLQNDLALRYDPLYVTVAGSLAAASSPVEDTTRVFRDGLQRAELPGWRLRSRWSEGEVLLGQSRDRGRWEFGAFCAATGRLRRNLDYRGRPALPADVCLRTGGMRADGGICYALDGKAATEWLVDAACPEMNRSHLTFARPFSGKLHLTGEILSGVVLEFTVDDRTQHLLPPWEVGTLTLDRAREVSLCVHRIDGCETATWRVWQVRLDPQGAPPQAPSEVLASLTAP